MFRVRDLVNTTTTTTYFVSGATPLTLHRTLLAIARRTVRFRRPVLHVQVGNRREKTFRQQAGLLRACESHAVRSAQSVHVRYTVVCAWCALYAHRLYVICALAIPARSYATRCSLLPPRSGEACKARHATWLCAEPSGNRRRTTGAAASG